MNVTDSVVQGLSSPPNLGGGKLELSQAPQFQEVDHVLSNPSSPPFTSELQLEAHGP